MSLQIELIIRESLSVVLAWVLLFGKKYPDNSPRVTIQNMVQLPTTVNPPHRLTLEFGVIIFTRLASHIYDLSLPNLDGKCHFIGRIEQKSDRLWAVTYIDCQPCMPEYFDDWQQATLFLLKLEEIR